ncbi:MAG: MarR family transcriptional regulator [Clostridiales Family XIII bacterium]|nr:MarR family transcriptional regulator [Clostridiales Family XIII bacterium]
MDYNEAAHDFLREMHLNKFNEPIHRLQRLSKGEMFTMMLLSEKSSPITAGDICTAMNVSSARLSAILEKLEKKGIVERHIDETDRRKASVFITEDGRRFITAEKDAMNQIVAASFQKIGERDTKEFIRISRAFIEAIAEVSAQIDKQNGAN